MTAGAIPAPAVIPLRPPVLGKAKGLVSYVLIMTTLFILSKDKVYKDIEAEILLKIKDILRTKPSLRFEEQ